jgi:isoleucyl-tRNA synthetase
VADQTLHEGDFELAIEPRAGMAAAPLRANDAVVELDTDVDDELRDEGRARDVVRHIQQARRDAGLDISDRIALTIETSPALAASLEAHRSWIAEQVLADQLDVTSDGGAGSATSGGELRTDGETLRLTLRPAG